MSERPDWDRQFAETEEERNERLAARRRAGNSKLVYDKAKRTIVIERTARRVTAGPYTLELPANGVAILHEADGAGVDHQLPGGVGYLEALVQFAGEVIRLQAMVGQMQTDRNDQDLALRDAIRETGQPVMTQDAELMAENLRGLTRNPDTRALRVSREHYIWVSGIAQDAAEFLEWLAKEAAEYADGAPDSNRAAKFLTIVEQRAKALIAQAKGE